MTEEIREAQYDRLPFLHLPSLVDLFGTVFDAFLGSGSRPASLAAEVAAAHELFSDTQTEVRPPLRLL